MTIFFKSTSSIFILIILFIYLRVCMRACVCVWSWDGDQRTTSSQPVSYLHLPCGAWASHSGHQGWLPPPWSTEQSLWSSKTFYLKVTMFSTQSLWGIFYWFSNTNSTDFGDHVTCLWLSILFFSSFSTNIYYKILFLTHEMCKKHGAS